MTAITACRSCGSSDLFTFLGLGDQPLANALLSAAQLTRPEPCYPLEVVLCTACTLVQITESVDPEILFRDYLYFSSFSDTMLAHAKDLTDELRRERKLGPGDLVVEIASNDGYLLRNFVEAGLPVLGIEPARNVARVAIEHGIPTLTEFFGTALARRLAREGLSADVILANNVMAHVPDINDVVEGVHDLLDRDGAFVMETPYVQDMVEKLEFDTIYHEHYYYHSLTGLDYLYQRHGLAAIDVRRIPIHGGSLRVTVAHRGRRAISANVRRLLDEEAGWVGDPSYYADMGRRVQALRSELNDLLRHLRGDGARLAGYGAAAKGATLLNFMGIGPDLLDYVVDRSTHKQGKYLPGSHLPIRPPESLVQDRPDYVLLLAWNLADEILGQQAQYRRMGGRFIVPLPKVRIT